MWCLRSQRIENLANVRRPQSIGVAVLAVRTVRCLGRHQNSWRRLRDPRGRTSARLVSQTEAEAPVYTTSRRRRRPESRSIFATHRYRRVVDAIHCVPATGTDPAERPTKIEPWTRANRHRGVHSQHAASAIFWTRIRRPATDETLSAGRGAIDQWCQADLLPTQGFAAPWAAPVGWQGRGSCPLGLYALPQAAPSRREKNYMCLLRATAYFTVFGLSWITQSHRF